MPAVAVIGGQWGDEGKGKVIDLLAEKANVVVRFSGGNNAGHTVINKFGEFRMHLIPSGIFYPGVVCLIGNGVGPAFGDKTARRGIRICDLLDKETFKRRLSQVLEHKNSLLTKLYDAPP